MTTNQRENSFDSIESAIADIAGGGHRYRRRIRENEGDLVMATSKVSAEAVNQMALHARGLICVPMLSDQPFASESTQWHQKTVNHSRPGFAVSVDAAEGITTGISAQDRAETIRILADPNAEPKMLVQPGHVFPLEPSRGRFTTCWSYRGSSRSCPACWS